MKIFTSHFYLFNCANRIAQKTLASEARAVVEPVQHLPC